MSKEISVIRALFLALSALLNTIPGFATLLKVLGTPPGYKFIFSAVVEAVGVLSLLVMYVNREKIKVIAHYKVTIWAIVLGIMFFVCVCCYIFFFNLCVVQHDRGSVYFPIWLEGPIADMVSRSGGRSAAITKYGIDTVHQAIEQITSNSLGFTTVILLVVYQTMFTALGVAFGLLGFHKKTVTLDETGSEPKRRILIFCHKH